MSLKSWLIKFFNGIEHSEVVVEAEHAGEAIAIHAEEQVKPILQDASYAVIDEAKKAAMSEITSVTEHVVEKETESGL